ncbi:unnamed protein product [Owenia fusiformis]|uniref:Uncharacterized protein n=1 Tax=Owenia fusiformis TaxID=6347 RepID=A0A8J1UHM6_OWEFU|nr:unnamed protein product [Owenia fusiformis]
MASGLARSGILATAATAQQSSGNGSGSKGGGVRFLDRVRALQYPYNNEFGVDIDEDVHDTYDRADDDETNSGDLSVENFYDASAEDAKNNEVRLDLDPTERLIEAIESLRDTISDNTTLHQKQRGRRKVARNTKGGPGGLTKADERLKIRKDKVIVELRVVFLKVGEIDTLKEQYSADAFIQAKWREPALDGKSQDEIKHIELERYWNPLLYIDNIINETKDHTWLAATVNSRGEAYVMERRRIRGIFLENLELNDFPLDVQDLTITISTERPDTEIDIIPDEYEMSGINVQTFVDQQEWKLHEHIEVNRKVMTQDYSTQSRSHPALSVTCRAARRPGFFFWNVFLIMFFITALSFATFAVEPDKVHNRLQLSFTLLLTSVAFKFVINQSLPKISYLTYMDKYVLLSLVILCIVCIWHSLVTLFKDYDYEPKFIKHIERDVFISFSVLYVLVHILFILWLYFDACKRRRDMKRKDAEYLEFLAKRKEWQEKMQAHKPPSRRTSTILLHSVHAM